MVSARGAHCKSLHWRLNSVLVFYKTRWYSLQAIVVPLLASQLHIALGSVQLVSVHIYSFLAWHSAHMHVLVLPTVGILVERVHVSILV